MAVTALTATTQAAAINYSYTTSGSSDWSGVSNSTYFYDLVDKLPHYKNSSGTVLEVFSSAGGLTYFTETGVTTSPNATVPVVGLIATSGATNLDVAIVPKGSGAILADIPDNTAAGGNKRGQYAIDLSTSRGNAANVASGDYSVLVGQASQASGISSIAIGQGGISTGQYALSIGLAYFGATASNLRSICIGARTVCSGQEAIAIGGGTYTQTTASGDYSIALGVNSTASGLGSVSIGGEGNIASGVRSYATGTQTNTFSITGRQSIGYYNTVSGDCQKSTFPLGVRTTGDTATSVTVGGGAATTTNQVILQNNSAYGFTGTIVGKQSGTTNACMWKITGLIARGANAASTTLTFSSVDLVSNNPGWGTPVLSADTTNGGLQVQVIGSASTNIQWTCMVETTEVIYG